MSIRQGPVGAWVVGIALGVLLLGPMLGPGSLLNLDLILIDPIPLPAGTWGLGPELPRRVPLMIPIVWASSLVGSWLVTRALLVGIFAVATAGMHRLAVGLPTPVRFGLALLYGGSPFLMTRVGVGHLGIAVATALLPWTLPSLLRPTRSTSRTVLAAAVLGLTGITGGTYAGLALLTGLIADRPPVHSVVRTVGLATITQVMWIVPGIVVFSQGLDPSNSVLFGARVQDPVDVFRLVAGHGFWQDRFQVGFGRIDALVVGVTLAGLAALGTRSLPPPWRGRGAALAGVVVVVVIAGAVPVVDERVATAAGTLLLAPLREAHRLLPLALVWLLLAAGYGVVRLGAVVAGQWGPAVIATPLALAAVLTGPGLWGLGDDLEPFDLHSDWEAVRAEVEGEPGAIVALPWAQYLSVAEFDGRRMHHPAPFALAGDVIVSSDPGLGDEAHERADEREPLVDELIEKVRDGDPIAVDLADIGVRWVLILHTVDWESYTGLTDDPGLRQRVTGTVLDLYEVPGFAGPVVTAGDAASPDWRVRPLGRVDAPDGGSWLGSAPTGWMRGLTPVTADGPGGLAIPSGSGLLWYWPTALVVVADITALTLAGLAFIRVRRSRPATR